MLEVVFAIALVLSPPITVERDLKHEQPLEHPWSTLFPLSLEERTAGKLGKPPTLVSISASTIRIQIEEGSEVVKYEGPLAGTPLAPALEQLSSVDMRGAFVVTNENNDDGSELLIRNRSGHFVFRNCNPTNLPDGFHHFAAVLAAYRQTLAKRESLAVISREPADLRVVELTPKDELPSPSANLLPLSVIREFASPDEADDWFGVQINEDRLYLHLFEAKVRTVYSGLLADTVLAAALADLTAEDLSRARRISSTFHESAYDTVINGPVCRLAVQGSGRGLLRDDYAKIQRLIDAAEELAVHKKGLALRSRDTQPQSSGWIEELPHLVSALGAAAPSVLPLRIERGTIDRGLRLPRDVLELSDAGVRLTAIEGNTRANYEGKLEALEIAELLAAIKAEDLHGAHRIFARNSEAGEFLMTCGGGLKSIRAISSEDLGADFETCRLAVRVFERAMQGRARLTLVRREPLSAEAGGPIACTIRAAATCALGSAPKVEFEIMNRSEKDLYLANSLEGSEFGGRYPLCLLQLIRPDGSRLPAPVAVCGVVTALTEYDFVKVPAGKTFDPFAKSAYKRCFALDPSHFNLPGEYRLRFVYSTESDDVRSFSGSGLDVDNTFTNERLMQYFAQVPRVTIMSNEISVTVAK